MVDIDAAQAFLDVVSAGSLSAAARRRGSAQSTLSRLLERLERQLGARLVERSSRAFRLTAAGHRFEEGARILVREAEALAREVAETSRSSEGTLRLSLCPGLGRRRLLEPTAAFLRERPGLRVVLRLEDRVVDPIKEPIDVAVRVGSLGDSGLSCQRLGTYEYLPVAAPRYLLSAPPLAEPGDLARHATIGIRGAKPFTRWRFASGARRVEVEVLPVVETNDAEVLRGMTVAGAGVTVLPDYLAEEDLDAGRLVRVLSQWQLSRVPIFAVYASAAGLPRPAREWIAVVRSALSRPDDRADRPRRKG